MLMPDVFNCWPKALETDTTLFCSVMEGCVPDTILSLAVLYEHGRCTLGLQGHWRKDVEGGEGVAMVDSRGDGIGVLEIECYAITRCYDA